MIYTINNCIRAFGYTNFDRLIEDMGSVDNLKAYVRANGYADIAVAEDTELLLVDVNGKTWHTGCYGAKLEPEVEPDYLCFTSKSWSSTVKTLGVKKTIANTTYIQHLFFDYKINDGEWQRLKPGSISGESEEITLHYNDKLYVKADDWGPNTDVPKDAYTRIYVGGEVECSGNIMSLCGFKKELTHEYQFYNLFYGSKITTAPKLPATTLTEGCYEKMFSGCTSLVKAPELPATTLTTFCYADMFEDCTSLVNAPELPALELADNCYWGMFSRCSKLNYVKALFLESYNTGNMADWLSGVSETGTFVKNPDATWQYAQPNIPSGWTIKTTNELEQESLCFTSTGDSTVSMVQEATPEESANKVIQYKINNGQWQTWDLSPVTLTDGDKMYVKSDDDIPLGEFNNYKQFVMTGSIAASGNIMSLYNFFGSLPMYAFAALFKNCTSLTAAPELPATTLVYGCYNNMFYGCTSLTTAPELPATTLTADCYSMMFYGCTSLTQAPELPATTLTADCYLAMFYSCTSLVNAPALPATTLANECYREMFQACTSLTQAPELPATTVSYACYQDMFNSCTSLTTAPELQATTLDSYCYNRMFEGCTSLTQAPELPATTLADNCYNSMFWDCTSLTHAPSLPATTMERDCYRYMFYNCTSLTTAPELPATTIADNCYLGMFYICSNLNYVKAMFTTDPATDTSILEDWLYGVSSTGTFVKNSAATWDNTAAGIPSGWTVQTASPDK